ncbi:MAG: hypothetical protein JXD22_01275 [Sedimentisphaerales bacterium]|nr:hypothetical protein [Sedimentisphaerales bacterium]
MSQSNSLTVVLGPCTNLARALLKLPWARSQELLLVGLDGAEKAKLKKEYPGAIVFALEEMVAYAPEKKYKIVNICCCAMGMIHPREVNWDKDLREARRDLAVLDKLLQSYSQASVHVIFVCSVLALSVNSKGRSGYYAGWKHILSRVVQAKVEVVPGSRFSVLYPGRLTRKRSILKPVSLLYSSYHSVAKKLAKIIIKGESCRRIIGYDGRIWLMLRGVATGMLSMRI